MPFGSIKLTPGVNTIATPTLNQAGISSCNLIRYRTGLVEKLGGWVNYAGILAGSITRNLHAWRDLASNDLLGIGSLESLKVVVNGASVDDITPQTLDSDTALDLSTIQGSSVVTIIDTNIADLFSYDSVFFRTPISIGGIVLGGMYQIRPTPLGTTYSISVQAYATATESNAGTVPSITSLLGSAIFSVVLADHGLIEGNNFTFPITTVVGGSNIVGTYPNVHVIDEDTFEIVATAALLSETVSMNTGLAGFTYSIAGSPAGGSGAYRYGAPPAPLGQYALGEGYSTITTNPNQPGVPITATDWTSDNWGEILVACPRGGGVWYWSLSSGFESAAPVGNGPAFNNGLFIAMPAQILVCWGSTVTIGRGQTDADFDPLIVRWSDQLNFLNWSVTSRTQAGSFRIPNGSEIRGGIQGATQAYIFTDIDVWSMQYMGPPLVFSFNQIGTGCGLVGPHAVANLFGKTYWMGDNNFFVTGGAGVASIPCTVWDTVFYDLDSANAHKCVAAANSGFSEIFFFYPSASGATGECDKYVKFNVVEGEWDYGDLSRSAWIDRSVAGNPIGADPDTTALYQHEEGYSADGVAMNSFFETGYTAYGDGENFAVIDYFEPDFKWQGASPAISMTLTAARSPNGPTMISGPFTVDASGYYVTPRLRGRQVKWRADSDTDLDSFWRIGNIRYRWTLDGRR